MCATYIYYIDLTTLQIHVQHKTSNTSCRGKTYGDFRQEGQTTTKQVNLYSESFVKEHKLKGEMLE